MESNKIYEIAIVDEIDGLSKGCLVLNNENLESNIKNWLYDIIDNEIVFELDLEYFDAHERGNIQDEMRYFKELKNKIAGLEIKDIDGLKYKDYQKIRIFERDILV